MHTLRKVQPHILPQNLPQTPDFNLHHSGCIFACGAVVELTAALAAPVLVALSTVALPVLGIVYQVVAVRAVEVLAVCFLIICAQQS